MTTSTSSTVDEIQQRNATARGRVIAAAMGDGELGWTDDDQTHASKAIEAALMELAQVWTDEAQYFTEQKRRGWKSTAEELSRCAARLRGFAIGLTTRDVQMPRALVELDVPTAHLSPADLGKLIEAQPLTDDELPGMWSNSDLVGGETDVAEPIDRSAAFVAGNRAAFDDVPGCPHPAASRFTSKGGMQGCAACGQRFSESGPRPLGPLEVHDPQCACGRPECVSLFLDPTMIEAAPGALTADNFLPAPPPVEHHIGDVVTVGGIEFTKISDDPFPPVAGELAMEIGSPIMPVAVDNPFTSPAAPGSNRPPVKRLTYGELGPLVAATYPVPRPALSHSFVEKTERCGLSALLSDASGHRAVLGPRRPSWALLGGSAFHLAVESIERTAIELGGTSPLTAAFVDVTIDWEKFWEEVLAQTIDEQKAALTGTAYANPSTWHVANKGLEGFDWWRVEGLAMIRRYLEFHDNAWRATHTLLQVPDDPFVLIQLQKRVPVLEFPFTALAGSTSMTIEGRIDAAWLSTSADYPTATLEVIDYKAGKSVPTEHFQLSTYADVLRRYLPPNFALPIVGRYWLARQGRYTAPVSLSRDAATTTAEIDYRYTMANRKVGAGVFEPSVSNFCASCSSLDYCPAQSMRDAS